MTRPHYLYLALACVVVGLWAQQSQSWLYSIPLYVSAICLAILAFVKED